MHDAEHLEGPMPDVGTRCLVESRADLGTSASFRAADTLSISYSTGTQQQSVVRIIICWRF